MAENKNNYLALNYGATSKGTYAFHMEGIVGREPYFHSAGSGKATLSFSMAIGRNVWSLLGLEGKHPESNWINVVAFNRLAESLNGNILPGSKVVVCGRIEEESYTAKDGSTGSSVKVLADNIYPLACRVNTGGEPGTTITANTNNYTGKDGAPSSSRMVSLLAGTVKNTYPTKDIQGTPTVSFDLELAVSAEMMAAIGLGSYQVGAKYSAYRTVRCTVWGQRAMRIGNVIAVGNTLVITGIPSIREYNGKAYVNFNVREISVMQWGTPRENNEQKSAESEATTNASAPSSYATPSGGNNNVSGYNPASDFANFMDDDDDDLPF